MFLGRAFQMQTDDGTQDLVRIPYFDNFHSFKPLPLFVCFLTVMCTDCPNADPCHNHGNGIYTCSNNKAECVNKRCMCTEKDYDLCTCLRKYFTSKFGERRGARKRGGLWKYPNPAHQPVLVGPLSTLNYIETHRAVVFIWSSDMYLWTDFGPLWPAIEISWEPLVYAHAYRSQDICISSLILWRGKVGLSSNSKAECLSNCCICTWDYDLCTCLHNRVGWFKSLI